MLIFLLLLICVECHDWHPTSDESDEFPKGYKQMWVYVGNRTDGDKNYSDKSFGKLHSQYEQDKHILKIFRYFKKGTFIDLAANEAVYISNTFALERDYNWTGICIDANYYVWQDLAHRKCSVLGAAVGRELNEEIPFKYRNAGKEAAYAGLIKKGMKQSHRTPNEGTVFTTTLNDIFKFFKLPRVVDYLSIDVEGAEDFVLLDFDWDSYHFNAITIEQPTELMKLKLAQENYWYVTQLGQDQLYVWAEFMSQNEARDLIDDIIT